MSDSFKKQIAQKFGAPLEDLKAVIYVSDRSWTRVRIYGPKAVESAVRAFPEPFKPKEVSREDLSALNEVPDHANIAEAAEYGLQSGKVLLVQ